MVLSLAFLLLLVVPLVLLAGSVVKTAASAAAAERDIRKTGPAYQQRELQAAGTGA